MPTGRFGCVVLATAALTVNANPVGADVRLPAIFGDHMVLQQDAKLPVWGKADPGERVTVDFAGQSATTNADPDGRWRVDLTPVPAADRGQPLAVRGNNLVTFTDVVVGDVWLASGQSNMEFGLQIADGGKEAIAKGDDASLRLFLVPYATSLTPLSELATPAPAALEGKWHVCTPEVLGARWGSNGFSAIGYFFGREIRAKTGRPVGIVGSYRGGSAAQAWTSVEGLRQDPRLSEFVERQQQWVDGYAEAAKAYPAKQAAYAEATAAWERDVRGAFITAMEEWNAAVKRADAAGAPPPPKPVPSRPRPQPPIPPDGGYFAPGNLYNGMIAPLVPYAMRGVIWYQGEANTSTLAQAVQYESLFARLISDWRAKWGAGEFPFLFVQLAGYRAVPDATLANWAWLRESQAKTLALPNTAMASAVDIGDPFDAHAKDKLDVAKRLSLAARKVAYGESIAVEGPRYASMSIEANAVRVRFETHGQALAVAAPPWRAAGAPLRDPSRLAGFLVAGADQRFVPADARVDGDAVIVASEAVPQPVAVRYNWTDFPEGNLYDVAGLPAAPFRTDAWEPAPLENTALRAAPGTADWRKVFDARVVDARKRQVDVVFDGDSIIDRFQTVGRSVWEKAFAGRNVANFAMDGDQTGQMLFRLRHGQMDGLDPKLIVLMIGMNNATTNSAAQIADGVRGCVDEYLRRSPRAHVLLLATLPRRAKADPLREKLERANAILSQAAFGDRVTFLDVSGRFTEGDGSIRAALMPGLIHPGLAGYETLAEVIRPIVDRYAPAKGQAIGGR